jgi:hypothetical protein
MAVQFLFDENVEHEVLLTPRVISLPINDCDTNETMENSVFLG